MVVGSNDFSGVPVIVDVITLGDSLVPLIRSESQGAPLLDHYKDSDTCSEWVVEMNAAMRSLIPALNAKLPSTTVWGLTSHNSLGLMSVPKYDAGESHVNIEHFEFGYFRLGYRPPNGLLPFPDAYVQFSAAGEEEAIEKLLIAMAASGGWLGSPDLPVIA